MQSTRIGVLLTEFDLVSPEWVERALRLSRLTAMPTGKCLVLLDQIRPQLLTAVIEAQSMIREKLLGKSSAKRALAIVERNGWAFSDALTIEGVDAHGVRGTRLGELLLVSGVIRVEELSMALKANEELGIPLGRVLVLFDKLQNEGLKIALTIQNMVRSGFVDKSEAIDQLINERKELKLRSELKIGEFTRLETLLGRSNLVSEVEIQNALKVANENNTMFSLKLLDEKILPEEILLAATQLQELVCLGAVSEEEAIESLRDVFWLSRSVEDRLKTQGFSYETFDQSLSFYEFLRLSGFLSDKILDELLLYTQAKLNFKSSNKRQLLFEFKKYLSDEQNLYRLFKEYSPASSDKINAGYAYYELFRSKKLRLDQVIVRFSLRTRGVYDKVLS